MPLEQHEQFRTLLSGIVSVGLKAIALAYDT
jgi:hypothetical protein